MNPTKPSLLLLIILGSLSGLTPLAVDMYLPAIPSITQALDTRISLVQLTLSVFLVGFAIGQMIYGPLSDSLGRKKVLLSGLFIFVVSNALVYFAQDITTLMILRFIQAIGGGAGAVIVSALLRDMFAKDAFSKVMSFVILIMTIAPLVAPLLGGQILLIADWRAIFYLLSTAGLLTAIAVMVYIPETLPKENRIPLRLGSVARNYIKVLKHRRVLGFILTSGFSFSGMFIFLTTSPYVYIEFLGIPTEQYGYYFGLNIVFMMILTWSNGRFVESKGYVFMLQLGLSLLGFAALMMLFIMLFNVDSRLFIVAAVVSFVGVMSLIGSNGMAGILNEFSDMAGTATALTGTLRFGMGAVAGAIVSLFHSNNADSMAGGMFVCAVLSITSYLWLVKPSNDKNVPVTDAA
ncbi:Bcr/CflA family multidrug efflux MFS transporter [Motilimonas cestriensis]|uniref:Bcr/CflA family efflux transporter n=1 Tax=Motilimonas cestriensis TaxID=2742685 RepID=A0ABS8WCE7_9GAMM|nr:Bcr/CflA family multidrug efflux MFS transporter [Motilimonas cestriensis]MCE2595286.1 Bcr/CflA family multidrug efflux MFS transporter [Motilimonas cestriensis]